MARRKSYSAFSYWNMKSNLFALLTVLFLLSFHNDGNGSTLSYFSFVIGEAPWKAENFPFLLYVIFPLEIMPWKIVCTHNRLVDRFERFFFVEMTKSHTCICTVSIQGKLNILDILFYAYCKSFSLSIPYTYIFCFHSTVCIIQPEPKIPRKNIRLIRSKIKPFVYFYY